MKYINLSILIILTFSLTNCNKKCKTTCEAPTNNGTEEFIFSSGYEDNVIGFPIDAHEDITGSDISFISNNDWENDLENNNYIGNFKFYYEDGNYSDRYARIISEPNNTSNKVLHFWLNNAAISSSLFKKKGRISANLTNNTNLREFYIKQKLFIHSDWSILKDYDDKITWLTIQEFWNDLPKEDFPFRVTLNIQKVIKGQDELYFGAHGQTRKKKHKWDVVWETINTDFPVPIGEWITIETYFKEGDADNGKFKFVITDNNGLKTEIININNFTYHPDACCPDGVGTFNVMKLYTDDKLINYMNNNNKTLQVYWDNLEFYVNKSI